MTQDPTTLEFCLINVYPPSCFPAENQFLLSPLLFILFSFALQLLVLQLLSPGPSFFRTLVLSVRAILFPWLGTRSEKVVGRWLIVDADDVKIGGRWREIFGGEGGRRRRRKRRWIWKLIYEAATFLVSRENVIDGWARLLTCQPSDRCKLGWVTRSSALQRYHSSESCCLVEVYYGCIYIYIYSLGYPRSPDEYPRSNLISSCLLNEHFASIENLSSDWNASWNTFTREYTSKVNPSNINIFEKRKKR